MVNAASRSSWLILAWVLAVAMIVAASIAMGANRSTTVVLVALSLAPAIVIALLAHREPSPSVSDILHPAEANDDRS